MRLLGRASATAAWLIVFILQGLTRETECKYSGKYDLDSTLQGHTQGPKFTFDPHSKPQLYRHKFHHRSAIQARRSTSCKPVTTPHRKRFERYLATSSSPQSSHSQRYHIEPNYIFGIHSPINKFRHSEFQRHSHIEPEKHNKNNALGNHSQLNQFQHSEFERNSPIEPKKHNKNTIPATATPRAPRPPFLWTASAKHKSG